MGDILSHKTRVDVDRTDERNGVGPFQQSTSYTYSNRPETELDNTGD
jgi:hypothetical protein